jgi:O-antigen/teichoic acid export membrane protein
MLEKDLTVSGNVTVAQPTVSRRTATIVNLIHQYATIGLTVINGIVLVPLYLHFIEQKMYGAWLATGNIVGWLAMVDMGLSGLVRQQSAMAYGSGNKDMIGKVIGTGSVMLVIMGIIPGLVGLGLAGFIPKMFKMSGAEAHTLSLSFVLVALAVSTMIMSAGPTAAQQGLQRNISFSIIYISGAVFGIVVTVVCLYRGYGVLAIPLGLLARNILWFFAFWTYLIVVCRWLGIRLRVARSELGKFGSLTCWTFFSRLAYSVFLNCDTFVVGLLMGVELTPVYSLSMRGWDMLNMLLTRVGIAFMPGLAHLYGEGQAAKLRVISRRLLQTVGWTTALGVGACLCFNSSFVSLWVGRKFYAGNLFNSVMTVSLTVSIFTFTINQVLFAANNIKGPSLASMIQYVARAGLLVLLVWLIGYVGGPLSRAIAFVCVGGVYFIRQWMKTLQISKTELYADFGKFIRNLVTVMVVSVIFYFVPADKSWTIFAMSVLLYGAMTCGVLLVIDREFRLQAGGAIRTIFSKLGRHR